MYIKMGNAYQEYEGLFDIRDGYLFHVKYSSFIRHCLQSTFQ